MDRMITNWKARRSGAAMTITGTEITLDGPKPITIAGIATIETNDCGPFATTADGERIVLCAFASTKPVVPALQ